MKVSPADIPDAARLNEMISHYIAANGEEIEDRLYLYSAGEYEMVETISAAEKRAIRQIFAWVADQGAAPAWNMLTKAAGGALMGEEATEPESAAADGVNDCAQISAASVAEIRGLIKECAAHDLHGVVGVLLILLSYIFFESFHYPQPEAGRYNIADSTFDKLKWLYRYWYNQLEVAERGSGLEDFFTSQVLANHISIDPSEVEAVQRISLSCAGDLLAVDALLEGDTEHLFDGVAEFYSSADIVSANLESTVWAGAPVGRTKDAGKPYRMNTSVAMLERFRRDAGINFFSTATNHANDWGVEGIAGTIDEIRRSGARYAGTATSEAEQQDVVVVEKNGIKVALLSYTFDLNGRAIPADQPYLVNEVRFNDAHPAPDYSLIEQQVLCAKEKGAEFIVAYCHWGWEFEMYPHPAIVAAAHSIAALGVDVIIGNHAHVSQPAQIIERGPGEPNSLVFYALGDFVSFHPFSRNSALAYMLKFDIAKVKTAERTVVSWDNLQVLPIYIVNEQKRGSGFRCSIAALDEVEGNPEAYGLTAREKAELPHLRGTVWEKILAPLSHVPAGGWSGSAGRRG